MAIDGNRLTLCILAGMGVLALLYLAQQQTLDKPIPQEQKEEQFLGLGVILNQNMRPTAPLNTHYAIHGYHPGFDPDPSAQPVVQPKVRYPVVPGGNISTVMHKGWSAAINDSPAGNDWRITPPEAANL